MLSSLQEDKGDMVEMRILIPKRSENALGRKAGGE